MSHPYSSSARWPVIGTTTVLWALAVASVVFWGLRLSAPSGVQVQPAAVTGAAVAVDPAAVAQMLGAVRVEPVAAARPDAATRFVLQGVVADDEQQGAALIAVDGRPARPFRVGSELADGFVLQSVTTRAATIGGANGGAAAFSLQLPTPPLAVNSPPGVGLAPNR
ncbi:General secretion pathway protein C [Burkholderiales bacterium 8X]|nr:General secretion pathway protein C [Burkholderiales bacterium 8X]